MLWCCCGPARLKISERSSALTFGCGCSPNPPFQMVHLILTSFPGDFHELGQVCYNSNHPLMHNIVKMPKQMHRIVCNNNVKPGFSWQVLWHCHPCLSWYLVMLIGRKHFQYLILLCVSFSLLEDHIYGRILMVPCHGFLLFSRWQMKETSCCFFTAPSLSGL